MRAVKRKHEKQPRRRPGHRKPDDAAANGEQDAFRERLSDYLPGCGTDGDSHGRLAATCDAASE